MSGYRIVLNLTGNASAKVATLAATLEKADIAASSLARSLASVAAASHAVKPINLGHVRPPSTSRPQRPQRSYEPREPHYTRHRHTRILSYGTGLNIGGFSGRFSTILQPDANGNILGMSAEKLTRGLNITAIVGSVLKTVGTAIVKVVAGATIAPIAIGGIGLMASIRALQSESFAEGVRLISRRRQAQLGLGEDFERAQTSADFLSKSYGFDRSTTLSSINVLTGMGVGGTARKLNVQEAAGLTKVGGLISQQSGVSFERVMTNIQQLLVQTTPHVRDIREMLNQAPILGKYALRDMEEKGVKGVDVRTWLKDQNNIMSAFKRYEIDLASNAGMQARGEIALAQQDFWAKIASNDSFWRFIGLSGSHVIGSAAKGVDKLLTSLEQSDSFKVMVAHIGTLFDVLDEKGGKFVKSITSWIDEFSQKYGFGIGDRTKSRDIVGNWNAIDALVKDETFRKDVINFAESKGEFKNVPYSLRKQKEDEIIQDVAKLLKNDTTYFESIKGKYPLFRHGEGVVAPTAGLENLNLAKKLSQEWNVERVMDKSGKTFFPYKSPLQKYDKEALLTPPLQFAGYQVPVDDAMDLIKKYLTERSQTTKIPTYVGGKEDFGSDLTGFNKDRKALEIHFHAPIVEWNNTMEATNPEETVEAVGENIERLASAAIQKALLGASQKMSSRWY
jgi:hypothetical protein